MTDTRTHYADLQQLYLPIAACVFLLFLLVVAYAAVRYRRRGDALPRQRETSRLEVVYAAVLAAIAAFLVVATFRVEDPVDAAVAHPGLRVHVTAAQWNWRFEYPDYGITISELTDPTLVVPAGTDVAFSGTAQDVIHAFWVPERRYKKDLFPDAVTHWHLRWPEPVRGERGECAEFCGLHHAEMRFRVDALPPAEFRAWVRREQARQGAAR